MEIRKTIRLVIDLDWVRDLKKAPRLTKRQRKVLRIIFGV